MSLVLVTPIDWKLWFFVDSADIGVLYQSSVVADTY